MTSTLPSARLTPVRRSKVENEEMMMGRVIATTPAQGDASIDKLLRDAARGLEPVWHEHEINAWVQLHRLELMKSCGRSVARSIANSQDERELANAWKHRNLDVQPGLQKKIGLLERDPD